MRSGQPKDPQHDLGRDVVQEEVQTCLNINTDQVVSHSSPRTADYRNTTPGCDLSTAAQASVLLELQNQLGCSRRQDVEHGRRRLMQRLAVPAPGITTCEFRESHSEESSASGGICYCS